MAVELPPTLVDSVGLLGGSALQQLLVAVISWLVLSRLLRPGREEEEGNGVKSNLDDEFQYGADGGGDWKVKSLWIYPVKSCRGVEVQEVNVVRTGFEHDRQFMFAELRPNPRTGTAEWTFITQRQYPQMALIGTALHVRPTSTPTLSFTFPRGRLPFRSKRTVTVPLSGKGCPLVSVKIWKCTPEAYDVSAGIEKQLEELRVFLGAKGEVRLFRAWEEGLREVHRNAPGRETLGYQSVVGFADAYPLHMLNLASVRELNGRITDEIPDLSVKRFRANIIVSGPKAFEEDNWKKIMFGGRLFHAAARTVRCRLPNVNQDTGEKHMHEPDRTMRSYRNIDAGSPRNACLGMQLVPAETNGVLRVGDKLEIAETGDHLYIPLYS